LALNTPANIFKYLFHFFTHSLANCFVHYDKLTANKKQTMIGWRHVLSLSAILSYFAECFSMFEV